MGCLLLVLIGISPTVRAEDPKIAYWLHCAGCHLLDGRGAPPEVPSLVDEPGRIEAMAGGRQYLIRVPGVAQAGLDDRRLAEVMNYMLRTFSPDSLAADFRPYTAREVAGYRKQLLPDPLRRRAEILAAAAD